MQKYMYLLDPTSMVEAKRSERLSLTRAFLCTLPTTFAMSWSQRESLATTGASEKLRERIANGAKEQSTNSQSEFISVAALATEVRRSFQQQRAGSLPLTVALG